MAVFSSLSKIRTNPRRWCVNDNFNSDSNRCDRCSINVSHSPAKIFNSHDLQFSFHSLVASTFDYGEHFHDDCIWCHCLALFRIGALLRCLLLFLRQAEQHIKYSYSSRNKSVKASWLIFDTFHYPLCYCLCKRSSTIKNRKTRPLF